MRIKVITSLSLTLLCNTLFWAQNISEPNVVAKVGNIKIFEPEFIERYEFNPFPGKSVKRTQSAQKINFLYSLISEKLWATKALEEMRTNSEPIIFSRREIEKLFTRDALYKMEILDKVSISNSEMMDGISRSKSTYSVRYIVDIDSTKIFGIYSLLQKGIPFDSILVTRDEKLEEPTPLDIKFGDLQEYVEGKVFALNPNSFTEPIPAPDGWYIFYIYNIDKNFTNKGKDEKDILEKVKKVITERKAGIRYREYYRNFFKGNRVDVDANSFNILFKSLKSTFESKFRIEQKDSLGLYSLSPYDAIRIEKEIENETINSTLIRFAERPISLKYFLSSLAFDGFQIERTDSSSIKKLLTYRIRKFIEYELLYREGIKKGLNKSLEVTRYVEMWNGNYLAQGARNIFLESISIPDSLVRSYYDHEYKKPMESVSVNIVEILTDSIQTANKILAEIRKGKDIRALATQFTKRSWTKEKQGEFGFFPVTSFGEIGRIAGMMNLGEVYGPLKLSEGFSIFKLIDKKNTQLSLPPRPYEAVKEDLKRKLESELAKKVIKDETISLALKNGISINSDALSKADVTNIDSFAIRLLGFGGKITAVPIISPDIEWVPEYLKKKNEVLP